MLRQHRRIIKAENVSHKALDALMVCSTRSLSETLVDPDRIQQTPERSAGDVCRHRNQCPNRSSGCIENGANRPAMTVKGFPEEARFC
ncbi:hypothetical protein NKH47_26120 [Mesorhizobium sp. M1060]|uniref:hypothetical protein n=1 Tax=Mesorhizobium sp. M1060 TaxID=2957052 RepID=UPI00333834C1